jgi:hyperosmotically inducible protein
MAFGAVAIGCAPDRDSPDVTNDVETALNQAGYDDISVSQDRQRGIVTLSGEVESDAERQRAEQTARQAAGNMIIANEIAVRPMGFEDEAEDVARAQDDAIESNFEAMLAERQLDGEVDYEVTNGVIRLSGEVDTPELRRELEELAASVPNVRQVVNELEVNQRVATETRGG